MNDTIKIYCTDNSEMSWYEASGKSYRSDIFVKTVSGHIYRLYIYHIVRLQQDFETEIDYSGFYQMDPNVILVQDVTISNIKSTIEYQFSCNYFDRIKPIDENEINIEELIEI